MQKCLQILGRLRRVALLLVLTFVGSALAAQDSQNVSGVVKDKGNGDPLPGVNIVVKGTSNGTITDADGKFTIGISSPNDLLVFSFIGYKKAEIAASSSTNLTIELEADVTALEEIIVVGYGEQKKSVVTGSISKVSSEALANIPNGRIETALQGRVSGVTIAQNSGQPGSSSTIRIRGVTTFGDAGNNPLWVVDGIPVDAGGIGYLNQADIESIEVLKDATSAAIYGTRAATGVILVTTKKGKAGKFTIDYNGFVGTSAPARKLSLLNATQYASII
ncbi:MAG: TonB-dependent receptor plug domain-containing protein, partial [Cyclobacteriaceae bacterium]|nr:TonB-dependent receptor plug domain-containing protein [Cyclobacteriaceae bacterium]